MTPLLRRQAEPGGQLPAGAELIGIGDGGDDRGGRDHADTRDLCEHSAGRLTGVPRGNLAVRVQISPARGSRSGAA